MENLHGSTPPLATEENRVTFVTTNRPCKSARIKRTGSNDVANGLRNAARKRGSELARARRTIPNSAEMASALLCPRWSIRAGKVVACADE
jgi:hypothetical protein